MITDNTVKWEVRYVGATSQEDTTQSSAKQSFAELVIANTPNYFKRPDIFSSDKTSITIPANTQVNIGNQGYLTTSSTVLNLSTLGTAASLAGKDVYVFACQPDDGSLIPKFVLSLNSTVPSGYTATNSRKIGGFHCLCSNVGTISGHDLSDYVAGDILPLSCWDLLHRPISDPEGMVYSKEIGKWVDIYLASWDGTKLTSKYGAVPADGSSSPAFNGEMLIEYLGLVGKRPIYRNEFQVVAKGSNENTDINAPEVGTTGGNKDTASRRMISNYGLEDCCGFFSQWGADLFDNRPGVSWDSEKFYLSGYSWQDASVYNSAFDSQKYGSCYGLLTRIKLGVGWTNGARSGSRSVSCSYFPSSGSSLTGVRGVSEPKIVTF